MSAVTINDIDVIRWVAVTAPGGVPTRWNHRRNLIHQDCAKTATVVRWKCLRNRKRPR
jgi:hypothetical protein